MSEFSILSIRDAKLFRKEIRALIELRDRFLKTSDANTLRRLYETTGRLREVVKYLDSALTVNTSEPLNRLLKKITKRLDPIRQLETITKLLEKLQNGKKVNQVAVEVALSAQLDQKVKLLKKAYHCLSGKRFQDLTNLLVRLKSSRGMPVRQSDLLEARMKEFLAFPWDVTVDDRILPRLGISTTDLLYCAEIQQKLNGSNHPSQLLADIRKLAAVLDQIRAFGELQWIVMDLIDEWNHADLTLVSSSLHSLHETIAERKVALSDRVYPCYAAVVQGFLPSLRSGISKPVQKSSTVTRSAPVLKIVRGKSA